MGKKPKERVPLGNEGSLTHNPFAALLGKSVASTTGPDGVETEGGAPPPAAPDGGAEGASAKVEVRRERKGRGGKVVTLVTWLHGGPPQPIADYAKAIAKALGTGARVEEGQIVIQGDLSSRAAAFLAKAPATTIVLATQ